MSTNMLNLCREPAAIIDLFNICKVKMKKIWYVPFIEVDIMPVKVFILEEGTRKKSIQKEGEVHHSLTQLLTQGCKPLLKR